jgi:DNA-binding transcriptional LysR family regulator
MLRDIDTTLLRAFTAVVETGSVTAAARLLNRTQSAISLQIKRLEELLGVELFEREHRKLTLTRAGERLIGPAIRLVDLNDDIWGQMTTPEFDGEVRFGVPTDIVPTYIPTILKRYNRAWPKVRVTLSLGNSQHLLELLHKGEIDLALTTDPEAVRNAETLRVDKLVFVGAPNGRAHLISPLPLAIGDASCRFRPVVLDALREVGKPWRLVLEVSHQVAQEAMVVAGIAIFAALSDSVPPTLEVLGRDSGLPELPQFMINMHLSAGVHEPSVKALADHVRSEFQNRFPKSGRVLEAAQPTVMPKPAA